MENTRPQPIQYAANEIFSANIPAAIAPTQNYTETIPVPATIQETQNPALTQVVKAPEEHSLAIVPSREEFLAKRLIALRERYNHPESKRQLLPGRNPALSISPESYLIWSNLGFKPAQVEDIVRTAYDQNRNLIRERHVGDRFLEAMAEVMGNELEDYSTTPERLRRLKDMASKIQKTKDMMMTHNTNVTYRKLVELRNYEPEEILNLTEQLKEVGIRYPIWALAQFAKEAEREGISLENLVDRRVNLDSSSGFGELEGESDTPDWGQ